MHMEALTRSVSRLGETALDPTLWPNLLQEIAEGMGAFGAMLLQAGTPTVDVPWSPSLSRMREVYYLQDWNTRDLRALRSAAAVRRGLIVLTDEDLVSRDEVARDPYYTNFLASQRLTDFAAVAFRWSPTDVCGLVIERTTAQGAFTTREKQALALLEPRLTATAELTRMLGEASVRTSLTILDGVSRPALALGRAGTVIAVNAAAAALFDDDFRVRAGAVFVRDDRAALDILRACEHARIPFGQPTQKVDPILVRREGRLPLILRSIPLGGAAGCFLVGAHLLLTVTDPGAGSVPASDLLRSMFGMTGAEARLAIHLAAGVSLHRAAQISGITVETARGRLKAVFSKTGTRRQAELVALLGRV